MEKPIETNKGNIYINQTHSGGGDNRVILNGLVVSSNSYLSLTIYNVDELKPEYLLKGRAAWKNFLPDFYHSRKNVDGQLRSSVLKGDSVLLTGKPLSGKSRAIYQYLMGLNKRSRIIIVEEMQARAAAQKAEEVTDPLSTIIACLETLEKERLTGYFIFNDLEKFLGIA